MTNETAVSQEKNPAEKVFLNMRSLVKHHMIPSEKIIQLSHKQTHSKHTFNFSSLVQTLYYVK